MKKLTEEMLMKEIKKVIIKENNDDFDYRLCIASQIGDLETVKHLIELGADIDAKGGYPLKMSARNKHFNVVKFLVENGADIHADDDYVLHHSKGEIKKYLQKMSEN